MTDSLTIWGTDYTGVKGFKAGAQSDGPTGKNLYNPATKTDGYFLNSSGVLTEESTCSISDYIAVVPGENYVWSGASGKTGSNNKRVVGYTTAKAYSQVIKAVSVTGINIPYENSFTVPTGVYFVRLSYNTADSELMIEHGSTKTSYEPYTNIVNYAYLRPQGTKSITENGTGIDVAEYAAVDVSVSGGGGSPTIDSLTVTPSTSQQVFNSSSVDGYKPATVEAMPSGTEGTPSATKGTVSNHSVSVTPSVTNSTGYIAGGTKTGTAVTVTASELASGNKAISSNGTDIDVVGYSTVSVDVPTGTAKDSSDLTVSGATVNVPAGLYSSAASASVASGTAGTPTVTKGTISNNSVTVTPSVTNTTGYIQGGTQTGTGVSVSASELVSGTLSISANGTGIDVTNYESVDVSVSGGGSSYTLLHSEDITISTTSTTVTNVKTIKIDSGWTADDIIYIRIRDKAGPRNGYFYGSDNFIINMYAENQQSGYYQNILKYDWRYSNNAYGVRAEAGSSPYGVAISQVTTYGAVGISITVVKRYSSTYSLTINGTFTIDIYKVTPPTGKPFFE